MLKACVVVFAIAISYASVGMTVLITWFPHGVTTLSFLWVLGPLLTATFPISLGRGVP